MRTLLRSVFVGCALLLAVISVGCSSSSPPADPPVQASRVPTRIATDYDNAGNTWVINKVEFEGHDYIFFQRFRQAGVVHSPDCLCQSQTE